MPNPTAPRAPRGEGSVRFIESRNAYRLRYYDRHRRRHDAYSPGPEAPAQERAARAKLRGLLTARDAGAPRVRGRATLGGWMAEWLELKAGAAPETARAYEARWRLYLAPELGHIRLRELEAIDVARALRRLEGRRGERVERISASTVEAAYKVLSTALNDARRAGKVAANVAELVEIERHAPEVIPPSQAEIDAILEYLGGHWSAPILRALRWTGARHGEVLGLRRRDVDGAAGLVTFRRQTTGRRLKTHASHRTILVPATLADELEGMPARLRSELVFSTGPGAPIDERNVLRAWREATDALGIRPPAGSDLREYRPHDLRHAFATMLLEAGTALPVVSAWLGHGSLRELDRYGHVRPIPGGDSAHRILEAFGADTAARLGLAAGIPR